MNKSSFSTKCFIFLFCKHKTTQTHQDGFAGARTKTVFISYSFALSKSFVRETYPAAIICGLKTIFPPLCNVHTIKTVSFTSPLSPRLLPSSRCVYMHLVLRLFNMPIKLKFIFFSPLSVDRLVLMSSGEG
jgi:hypothetical protein